jgi:hypothetical protein
MVNEEGQLYTMEGVAAGIIMLLTAYIVVSTTSIYTTGDTHIPDMQLEQLGSDVLAMMDTRDAHGDARAAISQHQFSQEISPISEQRFATIAICERALR